MKKSEIINLIQSAEGTLRINPICKLYRWTVDPLYGTPVDRLEIDFSSINGMGRFSGSIFINARDYKGIIDEIEAAIRMKTQELNDYLVNALRNGYTI